jgi:hypothetical protein
MADKNFKVKNGLDVAETVTAATFSGSGANLTSIPVSGLSGGSATSGEALVYNGTNWVDGNGTAIHIGTPTDSSYLTSAASLSTTDSLTDGIAKVNYVLGKLIPSQPNNFPNSLSMSLSTATFSLPICTGFTQTTNGNTGVSVAAGTSITTTRLTTASFTGLAGSASTYAGGPGDSGTLRLYSNNLLGASRNLTVGNTTEGTTSDNGTYTATTSGEVGTSFTIANNIAFPVASPGFWEVLGISASSLSSVPSGWNTAYFSHTGAGNTNTVTWYYDNNNPGTPTVTQSSFSAPGSPTLLHPSGIPHYTSANSFTAAFTANRLSGDCYHSSNTFVTGTSGGAFATPSSITYSTAGISTPLTRNLYVASGSASLSTTAAISSGFGQSSTGPSVTVNNGYSAGSLTFTPGATILYKTGTSNTVEETSIPVTSVGVGSGNGARITFAVDDSSSTPNPSYTGSESLYTPGLDAFVGQFEAKNVNNRIAYNVTNYSTGHLPVGPNYSTHGADQYFTFRFVRSSVSKFNISLTATGGVAGCWVALPGTSIDTTAAPTNGWLDMFTAYAGGVPGTGTGGNGSAGCALGGNMTNTAGTQSKTCTFGSESSSNSANNYIYVRIKLTSGQSLSALSIVAATN